MDLVEQPQTENRFVTEVSWQSYEAIVDAMGERRVRVTFDRGQLEIMTLSPEHEMRKTLLSQLLEMILLEKGFDYRGGGSTTFKRAALMRGLEPDECYWISSFSKLGAKYDAVTGPPPDLTIEIEITQSCLDRMEIFRAFGIREVWRYTKKHELLFYRLVPTGYENTEFTPTFPDLPLNELVGFVQLGAEQGNSVMLRSFKTWLQTH